jgi:ABC-type dipeptide/oligopeptide/nickel transport system permease component
VERSALYVSDIPRNEKALDSIIKKYGLDDPLYVQYWRWLVGKEDQVTGKHRRSYHGDLVIRASAPSQSLI